MSGKLKVILISLVLIFLLNFTKTFAEDIPIIVITPSEKRNLLQP